MKPTKRKANKNIVVLDVANLVFRIAHTFPGILMRYDEHSNFNTGVIHGLIKTILFIYKAYKPHNVILVFEGNKENNPRYKHPTYKKSRVNRSSIDITNEMTLIRNIASLMGMICIIPKRGEADDGIAHVIDKLKKKYKIYLASNDHDMMVMLGKNVKILKKLGTNNQETMTHADFVKEWGFPPKYFSLFLAVSGDSSDCIPGIKGIGKAKGIKLFKQIIDGGDKPSIKTIAEAVYRTYKKKQLLDVKDLMDIVKEYYNLTKIRTNWPILIAVNDDLNFARIMELFEYMQFKQLKKDFLSVKTMCEHFQAHKRAIIKAIK